MLTVNLDLLMADLEAISAIGDEQGDITRLVFTSVDQSARRLFE